jgi:hypothetical protein
MSAGLDQLRQALAVKRGDAKPAHHRPSIPDRIVYATDGTSKELKRNGQVIGKIIYDPLPQ